MQYISFCSLFFGEFIGEYSILVHKIIKRASSFLFMASWCEDTMLNYVLISRGKFSAPSCFQHLFKKFILLLNLTFHFELRSSSLEWIFCVGYAVGDPRSDPTWPALWQGLCGPLSGPLHKLKSLPSAGQAPQPSSGTGSSLLPSVSKKHFWDYPAMCRAHVLRSQGGLTPEVLWV